MRIEIVERNYQASEHLKRIVNEKLSKLDKYFDNGDADCKVYFKKENNTLRTEVMLDYHGRFVRATEQSTNFYDNIDRVLPKIESQIRKYRDKFDKQRKNVAFNNTRVYEESEKDAFTEKIVKEKNFKLTPMTVDEAIEEMELLGHSFFVFFDVKTQSIKILYLRADGNLGLIEPQV